MLPFGASLHIGSGDTITLTFHDAENVDHELTPLWKGAAEYVSALYAASWVIKALDPVPVDNANDYRWL
jgi:hypothetical protein